MEIGENKSTLVFQVERETTPGSKEYISRELRVYHQDPQTTEVKLDRGYSQMFRKIGSRVAFVSRYQDIMFDKLGVDAVVEIDGGPILEEPLVIEQTDRNLTGMTLQGNPRWDKEKLQPGRSLDSVMLRDGGEFIGPIQAGFVSGQEATLPIGKNLDGKEIRLKVYDARPKSPAEIRPLPVS